MNKLLVLAISLFLAAACGPDTEAAGAGPSFGEQTTVADLPADFPHALIPPAYDRMEFIDMSTYGGLTTANFENSQNAAEAIRYYTELIGAASTTVPPQEDGEMTSIWNEHLIHLGSFR